MATLTTRDGTRLFYKDWGPKNARPIVFHHGWPLSADDWDNQMLFFLDKGYRVVAHDRRGHGRSDQTDMGNDMDTYAADVAGLARELDLKNAVHVMPVLLMRGEDDQVVPIDASARKAIKLLSNGTLKTYPGLSHGMFATHATLINADLLAFIEKIEAGSHD
jgi:pimeloyl-ACP methyl ester carboxylesterase